MNQIKLLVALLLSSNAGFAESFIQTTPGSTLLTTPANVTVPANPLLVFQPKLRLNNNQYEIAWTISPGYYLYRDKTAIKKVESDLTQTLPILFEEGETTMDELFGPQIVFRQFTVMKLPGISRSTTAENNQSLHLQVSFQGCQEERLCYPPISIDLFSDH